MMEIEVYKTVPDEIEKDLNSILYVDDEESNLRVFDSVFSRYYNVYTANNGSTAIEMLHEHEIHMIITDQKMPEMTGTDLLEKTLEDFPDIIRIILTGFADIQAIIKAINKCSIYKYITKPYENSEIKEIIDKGLEIYNMRQKKYKKEEEAALLGEVKATADPAADAGGNQCSLKLLNDLVLADGDFESYFDFHIDYHLKESNVYGNLYGDFTINTDDDGSCMYFITMKALPGEAGAFSYMYMKSKLRSVLDHEGNGISLEELRKQLLSVYEEVETTSPDDLKILSYNWETNAVNYLSTGENIKLYAIGDKMEAVKFKKKSLKDDYSLYTAKVEEDLMMYFWDYALAEKATAEAPDYFKQIVNHATSVPFDLQEAQIGSGIKSVAKHFEDALLYGIYIND